MACFVKQKKKATVADDKDLYMFKFIARASETPLV